MKEAAFQKKFLEALKRENAHGFKIAHMFNNMGGIPDLYVKLQGYPGCWIELKASDGAGYPKVNLTPLQRIFIRKEHDVGGEAGWCLLHGTTIYAGRDPHVTVASSAERIISPTLSPAQVIQRITNG